MNISPQREGYPSTGKRTHFGIVDESFDTKVKYSDSFYKSYIAGFVPNTKKRLLYRFVKRGFDISASLFVLIACAPIMLIIAIAIKCDSKGKIIFKQKRIGKNGEAFVCYKFRSMTQDAPADCPTSCLKDPDKYQTRVGRFLRKTSLDELPQLWCVLIGTMSVIGYRPLIPGEKKCNDMRRKLNVFSVKPGISGYAQVCGRDDVYYKNKAILDAEYVNNASVWLDLKLMLGSIVIILNGKGNNS